MYKRQEDINEASRVARDNGYHNKVVTMDGQVINAGGSFTGGSVQRSAGLFTRCLLYTSLIKALEENGIGRPSTYAPIITTIIDRGYVGLSFFWSRST